jgi:hypothetical protein
VFKGLGNLSNLQGMLKQALDVKGRIDEFKEKMARERVESAAGGGMVKVVMTGGFEVESIKIDPEIISKDDPEMIETLVRAAVNDGVRKIQEMMKEKIQEMTGGLELPGMP